MPDKNEKKPFDLDAFIVEDKHDPFEFVYAGKTWSLTNAKEFDAWKSLDVQSPEDGLRLAFGEEQFAEFRSLGITQSALQELFTRYNEFCGITGEDTASTSS